MEIDPEVPQDLVQFDDVLSRELDVPTILEVEEDAAVAGIPMSVGSSVAAADPGLSKAAVDSTEAENALLRAELFSSSGTTEPQQSPASVPVAVPGAPDSTTQPSPLPMAPAHQEPMPPIRWSPADQVGFESVVDLTAAHPDVQPPPPMQAPAPEHEPSPHEPVSDPDRPNAPVRGSTGFAQCNFWDRFEEATASAELFTVPPAAITVVIGALEVAVPVAERCQAGHWVSECDVFVLTEQDYVPGQPTWTPVRRPSDVVAVIEDGQSDFPLLVIDVPRELPAWVRPLVSRLRAGGVGLVHYVLRGDPSDEDLATWHGELGRPAVLDLASPVPPGRVVELLDRGEPVSSVAGMSISTELLLALRLNRA